MTADDTILLPSMDAFAEAAERLIAAGEDAVALGLAFAHQQALWGQVLADVAASASALPPALRDDLLRLAAIVLEDLEELEPDIALHITVNRAMRDGLADG